MIRNRVEYLTGIRWANDVVFSSENTLKLPGGPEKVLEQLRLGLQEKPADYTVGVQDVIDLVQNAMDSRP